jgi:hypothetical protein
MKLEFVLIEIVSVENPKIKQKNQLYVRLQDSFYRLIELQKFSSNLFI